MGNLNFAIIESKARFDERLANGEIDFNWVVFIQDTQEIWTHGAYYGATNWDTSSVGNRLSTVELEVVGLKEKDVKLKTDIDSVNKRIDDLSLPDSTIDSRLSAVETTVDTLVQNDKGFNSDISQLKLTTNTLTEKTDELTKNLKEIQTNVENNNSTINTRLNDLTTRVTNVETAINEIVPKIQTHVVLTQSEYDELLNTDQIKDNVFYYIEEQ